jgi:hypothetical protein
MDLLFAQTDWANRNYADFVIFTVILEEKKQVDNDRHEFIHWQNHRNNSSSTRWQFYSNPATGHPRTSLQKVACN